MTEENVVPHELVPDPELRVALQKACEEQYRGWLYGGGFAKADSRDGIADTMKEIQRQREDIERKSEEARRHAERVRREAEIMRNTHAREITMDLRTRGAVKASATCPVCGDVGHGNRKNGKPWCMKCDAPILPKEKHGEWLSRQPDEVEWSKGYDEPDVAVNRKKRRKEKEEKDHDHVFRQVKETSKYTVYACECGETRKEWK